VFEHVSHLGSAGTDLLEHRRKTNRLESIFEIQRTSDYSVFSAIVKDSGRVEEQLRILANILIKPETGHWNVGDVLATVNKVQTERSECPDSLLEEAVHREAFRNQPLGKEMFPKWNDVYVESYEDHNIPIFEQVESLRQQSIGSVIVVGLGVDHNQLVEATNKAFSQGVSKSASPASSKYVGGGQIRIPHGPLPEKTTVAVAFEGDSINGADSAAYQVLANLFGQAASPRSRIVQPGDGLSSPLFDWAKKHELESVCASNFQYGDCGLFGVCAVGSAPTSDDLPRLLVEQVKAVESSLTPQRLSAAKARTQIDFTNKSPSDLFKYLVQASPSPKSPQQFFEAVEKVTVDDIKRVLKRILASKPTVVAVGDVEGLKYL